MRNAEKDRPSISLYNPQFGNSEYTYLLGKTLQGVVEQFIPPFILVTAGFDGHPMRQYWTI